MEMDMLMRSLVFFTLLAIFSGFAQAGSVSVPGTATPYLAGMPDGSTALPDQAPYQFPGAVSG
jgi:hypothetical protein